MLDTQTRSLVKATAPVLKEHGVALTRHFYARMFEHNPELKAIFNQGHQRSGAQQQALAMAVAAYAEHIDNPGVLAPVLQLIAHKHVSLGIRREHYAIVGRHLLASIREVLGAEAATDELIAAWAAAYGQLAELLIGMEEGLYQAAATQPGGWTGWRGFRVQRKVAESDEITSFYLVPADGGPVPGFVPGQYVSVRVPVPELGLHQPRQYSLSAAPGEQALRISVKREAGQGGEAATPAGMVSNVLHTQVQEGDLIDVAPPMGDFVLDDQAEAPAVLISAGVGITPMMAMLEHLVQRAPQRPVHFLHAARHGGAHAFGARVRELAGRHRALQARIHYEHPRAQDQLGQHYDQAGRIELSAEQVSVLGANSQYYLCGPRGFMQAQRQALQAAGVPAAHIHAEAFGTGGV
ncbi:NO-inducible flavohemoprotein [Curvibacter gracilis]|uniref:NO-inducible flavohemoprotein n=1 Tax=Curvibacter gracilis TaxID=230310 RepID=UPI000488F2CF|nr:NO-inducible flavohemoprotein [Curvibacter gracilis]